MNKKKAFEKKKKTLKMHIFKNPYATCTYFTKPHVA